MATTTAGAGYKKHPGVNLKNAYRSQYALLKIVVKQIAWNIRVINYADMFQSGLAFGTHFYR